MISEKHLYSLAYHQAVELWDRATKTAKERPGDIIAQNRVNRLWEEVEEISNHLLELENGNE